MLTFDRAIAFFASNLKNNMDIGTMEPPPPRPPIFVNQRMTKVMTSPQNSKGFIGKMSLCSQRPMRSPDSVYSILQNSQ